MALSMWVVKPKHHTNMKTLTVSKIIADEIFESTGFDYEINEQENNDGSVTLTFDSPKDAAKFQKMAGL